MKKILFVLFVFSYYSGLGQQSTNPEKADYNFKMFPPSPEAFSLNQYGMQNVGNYTGSMTHDIPLYVFKTKNLSVPITLRYSSNGVKVNQVAGWVGMDWSLNPSGVISRVVMDEPDELALNKRKEYDFSYFEEMGNWGKMNKEGYDEQPDVYTYSYPGGGGQFVFDIYEIARTVPFKPIKIRRGGYTSNSTVSSHGFVIVDENGIKYYYQKLEIQQELDASQANGCKRYGEGINRYIASGWYLTGIRHPKGDHIIFEYDTYTNSYLAGVTQTVLVNTSINVGDNNPCPQGTDETTCYSKIETKGYYLKRIYSEDASDAHNISVEFNSDLNRSDDGAVKLNSIVVKKGTSQLKKFTMGYTFYGNTSVPKGNRMFLTSLEEYGLNNTESKPPYVFSYIDPAGLPERLSFGQDHWGYYNGVDNNQDFIPEGQVDNFGGDREPNWNFGKFGLLEEITYPTGGKTHIDYDPHTEVVSFTENPPDEEFSERFDTNGGQENYTRVFDCPEDQNVNVSVKCFYLEECPSGSKNIGNEQAQVSINGHNHRLFPDTTEEAALELVFSYRFSKGDNNIEVHFSTNGVYNLGVTIKIMYYHPDVTNEVEKEVGGLRVKRITDYNKDNTEINVKEYHYAEFTGIEKGSLEGGKVYTPAYRDDYSWVSLLYHEYGMGPAPITCRQKVITSNSYSSLFDGSGANVVYPYVTVSHGSNFKSGGVEYRYSIGYTSMGRVICCGEPSDIQNAPRIDKSAYGGKLTKERYFQIRGNEGVTIKEVKYSYSEDLRYHKHNISGIAIRKRPEDGIVETNIELVQCPTDSADVKYVWELPGDDNDCEYMVDVLGPIHMDNTDIRGWRTLAYDKEKIADYYRLCGINHTEVVLPDKKWDKCIDHLDDDVVEVEADESFTIQKYHIESRWQKLDAVTTDEYNEDGELLFTKTETYDYENPAHAQVTRKTTTFSNTGDVIVEKYSYPRDLLQDKQSVVIDEDTPDMYVATSIMDDLHIINQVIEKNRIVNGAVVGGQVSLFHKQFDWWQGGDKVLLDRVDKLSSSYPILESSFPFANFNSSEELEIHPKYETVLNNTFYIEGRLVEFVPKSGIYNAVLYGYGKQKPIAIFEGWKYADLETYFEDKGYTEEYIESLSTEENDEELLKNFFSQIRNDLKSNFPNVFLKSVTYDPEYGITSETDVNDNTSNYEYDGLGRLVNIKDHRGNIIKTYEYNYKQD